MRSCKRLVAMAAKRKRSTGSGAGAFSTLANEGKKMHRPCVVSEITAATAVSGVLLAAGLLASSQQQKEEVKKESDNSTLLRRTVPLLDLQHLRRSTTPTPWPLYIGNSQTTVSSCDFFLLPKQSQLARSRTVRHMQDTSTKRSLRSKYDVQWRRPL